MITKRIEVVKLSNLTPYDKNPRRNNKSYLMVAKSIEAFGYINPIVVNEEFMVLAGHTRLKALKHLKWEEAEVLVVSGLTEEQMEGFIVIDNRAGEYSAWSQVGIERLTTEGVGGSILKEFGITSSKENKEELERLIIGDKDA